jgi:hypothetical protein
MILRRIWRFICISEAVVWESCECGLGCAADDGSAGFHHGCLLMAHICYLVSPASKH